MGGYSCQRKSRYNFKEFYGIWKLPTDCKGSWPGDYKKTLFLKCFLGSTLLLATALILDCATNRAGYGCRFLNVWQPFIPVVKTHGKKVKNYSCPPERHSTVGRGLKSREASIRATSMCHEKDIRIRICYLHPVNGNFHPISVA